MGNIRLIDDERRNGNAFLADLLEGLDDEGAVIEDVLVVYTVKNEGTYVANNEMHTRDMCYMNDYLDKWVKDSL